MTRLLLILAVTVAIHSLPAMAAKQEQPKKFKFDEKKGYVLARMMGGDTLLLERINSADGKFFGEVDGAKKPKGEDDDAVVGGRRSFMGDDGRPYYLTSLTPGDWVVYGTSRTCMCMGSYKFTVRAGEVADLGEIEMGREHTWAPERNNTSGGVPVDLLDRIYTISDAMYVKPASSADENLPLALRSLKVVPADYVVGYEFSNRRGKLVNRAYGLPAIVPPRLREK